MSACACSATAASPPADCSQYARKSLYSDCIEEELRYKWIESEKAGYDLGESAIRRWVRRRCNAPARIRGRG